MTVGRPREFDINQALEAAMRLFWSQGYEATSLQNLLKAMGISKSSFYEAFGSKHQLFEQCLTLYANTLIASFREDLQKAKSGLIFIEKVMKSLVEEASSKGEKCGCLMVNTTNELAQRDKIIAKLVANGTKSLQGVFEEAVRRAQKEGDIPVSKAPEVLASFLVSSLIGLKTMVKGGADAQTIRDVCGVTMTALQ